MPNFTARIAGSLEVRRADGFGGERQTVHYQPWQIKATGCDREASVLQKFSADQSAVSMSITPLGADSAVASNTIMLLLADNPVDVRFGQASNTPVSGVRLWVLDGVISSVFLNIGSADTYVMARLYGGSGASIDATIPLP